MRFTISLVLSIGAWVLPSQGASIYVDPFDQQVDRPFRTQNVLYDEPALLSKSVKKIDSYGVADANVSSDEIHTFLVIRAQSTSVSLVIEDMNSKVSKLSEKIKRAHVKLDLLDVHDLIVLPDRSFGVPHRNRNKNKLPFSGRLTLKVRYKKGQSIDSIISGLAERTGKILYGLSKRKLQKTIKKLRPIAVRDAKAVLGKSYFPGPYKFGAVISSKLEVIENNHLAKKSDALINVRIRINSTFEILR